MSETASAHSNTWPSAPLCASVGAAWLARFDGFMTSAMVRLQVPGAAIAIIHRGEVVLSAAYGVKRLGAAERVDRATRFMIASATKPLTTLMMASLVGRRVIDWDEPISGRLDGFGFADPDATATLSFRRSVSNGTKLPRRDMEPVFRGCQLSPERAIATMRSLMPLGETYHYSNPLVAAGGYAAARACVGDGTLNAAYAKALSANVLEPLGMTCSSVAGVDPLPDNRAMPHELAGDGSMAPIPLHAVDFVQSKLPAAGVWATADDLAKYISIELGNGVCSDGVRLIAEKPLFARRAGGTPIEPGLAYGLGLFVTDSHGTTVLDHGGNQCGYTSHVLFIPEANSGFALVANAGSAIGFRSAVCAKIFEFLLGRDSSADAMIDRAKARRAQMLAACENEISTDQADDVWLDRCIGRYLSPELGHIAIRRATDGYLLESESWAVPIAAGPHVDGDRRIVALAAPLLGMHFIARNIDDEPTILFSADDRLYSFQRVS